MDQTERRVIDELFGKLRQVEQQSGLREPEAEQYIQQLLRLQPAAPYYMAQALIVQEQALKTAQARIQQLEALLERRQDAGGVLGDLFGGGAVGQDTAGMPALPSDPDREHLQRYRQGGRGQSFLGGALQTAMGVAGGVVLADLLTSAFTGDTALAEGAWGHSVPNPWADGNGTAGNEDAFADDGDPGGFDNQV